MRNSECGVRNTLRWPQPTQRLGVTPHSEFLTPHFERGADGETRTLVGRIARQFTKLLLSLLSHAGVKWPAEPKPGRGEYARLRTGALRHGLAPCSVRVRAGASLSKFAAQSRDTKAELNRRSQVCEVLAGTGVRVA